MPDTLRDAIDLADVTRFSAATLSQLVARLADDVEGVSHTTFVQLSEVLPWIAAADQLLTDVADQLRDVALG